MQPENQQIIVYGGTGYYGRKIVESLVRKGESVKVVSRNYESAVKIVGAKVTIFEGDVTNRETVIESLKNVKTVIICLSAMTNKLFRKTKAIERDAVLSILEAAKNANISRVLYLSGYEMRAQLLQDLNIPEFGAIKIEIEAAISQSGFNWTILGCSPAFEIFFAFLKNGKMQVPGGGYLAIATISSEDVGEITAQAALRNDLPAKRIKLTGPEAFTFPEVAEKISQISGRKIQHVAIPLTMVNIASYLLIPFAPFVRFLYKSLLMLNNFPKDLAQNVPQEHKLLKEIFDYESVTLEMDIKHRIAENKI